MNTAYKHLDARLRIGELTIRQWAGVLLGVSLAILWGTQLSPLGTSGTVVTSIYFGALPVGAALLASATEFDLWLLARSALAWRRLDGRFMPGSGDRPQGYWLYEDKDERTRRQRRAVATALDIDSLWEEA